ncbi:unnamed protein product, partial [marine sediment metagenome]
SMDVTADPSDVFVSATSGVVYQLHRQIWNALDITQYGIDGITANTFTVSGDGDLSSSFTDGKVIKVQDSTANDGAYTVVSTAYVTTDFTITVVETIPDTVTIDGTISSDDIHIANKPGLDKYETVTNLNTQTDDANGDTLINYSFSFVMWGVQNKSGEASHLMLNLPTGHYAKNSPDLAVTDAFNYSVYDIPSDFQGTGFLIARFTMVLETGGTDWTLYEKESLLGKVPNSIAGGGGGGGTGSSTFIGLDDIPNAYTGHEGKIVVVNSTPDAMEFVDRHWARD